MAACGMSLIQLSGCATLKGFFGLNSAPPEPRTIENPFGNIYPQADAKRNSMILRSKKDNQSFELELPENQTRHTNLEIPTSEIARQTASYDRQPAQGPQNPSGPQHEYGGVRPGVTDHAIAGTFPKGDPRFDRDRSEIESGLGLSLAEDVVPESQESYLAGIDRIKQLYRKRRFEAGLLEIDKMLRMYPTDPKLHTMRGTLLDLLGYQELALKSWEEALNLNPKNISLQRFLDRKKRRLATVPSAGEAPVTGPATSSATNSEAEPAPSGGSP